MGKNNKNIILEKISKNLQNFPTYENEFFVCPICLTRIAARSISEITEAHILPKKSKGKLKTYLCKKCNNNFGSRQDVWFGDYLNTILSEKWLFASNKKNKRLTINGISDIPGELNLTDDGALELRVYSDLMPPERLSKLRTSQKSGEMHISTTFPLLANQNLISLGFLTAAYLLWFKELGYSWVFQSHLNEIRDQILFPEKDIFPYTFIFDAGDKYYEKPSIGFFEIDHNAYPCAAIADRIVIFPSFNIPNIYQILNKRLSETITSDYELIRLSDNHNLPEPTCIFYRDEPLIFPDFFPRDFFVNKALKYNGDGKPPVPMNAALKPAN